MRYLSLFSGIEAASVAWHPLGWHAAAFAETEPFPCAVLAHHYPSTPNFGDVTRFKEWPDADVDIFVGGSPCQPFSVAGLRKGLDDPRGHLTLTYLAVVGRYRPRWVVWENVPGVLSDDGGRTFGAFLGALGEFGYGFAYRILDAQFFGVPQRRRRVFVVGHSGGWQRAAAVLFEFASLSGHPTPGGKEGQEIAGTLEARARSGGWSNSADYAAAGYMRVVPPVAGTVSSKWAKGSGGPSGDECQNLIAFHGAQDPCISGDVTHPLGRNNGLETCVAYAIHERLARDNPCDQNGAGISAGVAFTLDGRGTPQSILQTTGIRRLTPLECERLQGFTDNYTAIKYRGKPAKDDPRYKALGNSMAVPVMRWIGQRIAAVDQI